MSRSIRKPYIVDSLWKKEKKFATKRVRRSNDVHNNMHYKRMNKGNNFDDNAYYPEDRKAYRK